MISDGQGGFTAVDNINEPAPMPNISEEDISFIQNSPSTKLFNIVINKNFQQNNKKFDESTVNEYKNKENITVLIDETIYDENENNNSEISNNTNEKILNNDEVSKIKTNQKNEEAFKIFSEIINKTIDAWIQQNKNKNISDFFFGDTNNENITIKADESNIEEKENNEPVTSINKMSSLTKINNESTINERPTIAKRFLIQ